MLSKLLGLASLALAVASAVNEEALAGDDECLGDEECALNAVQLRGEAATPFEIQLIDDNMVSYKVDARDYESDATADPKIDYVIHDDDAADAKFQTDFGYDEQSMKLHRGGWSPGGDKEWGSGRGTESINGHNVRYYDSGMNAARSRCGGSGCALIVNPPGHRSVNRFHIHFVHYHAYGASLKKKLEHKVCGRGGWHGGGLPCGGKAAFFHGFPGVFSKAMGAGNIHHASVIAWPASCGGSGTIIEIAYGCSIEHQIRGDFNPHRR